MSSQPDTPIEAADLLWVLTSLCGVQRLPFDARLLLQQYPPPLDIGALIRAGDALGLRIHAREVAARDLREANLPAVAIRAEGASTRLALVLSADSQNVLVAERDLPPRELPLQEFSQRYQAALLLALPASETAAPDAGLTDRPFGLGWFLPELLRHKAVWREVLAASLVLQLVSLAVPLCSQVIIDKVVVHQSTSTLAVILSALGLFVIFSAALSYV
ncbi:MAG: hypothetical protein ACRET8_09100, partial [Burkholderiales bacterium]